MTRNISKHLSWKFLLQLLVLIGGVFFFGWRIDQNLTGMMTAFQRVHYEILLVSWGILVVSFLLFPVGICTLTMGHEYAVSYWSASRTFYGSFLLSYIPGGIWGLMGRVWILRDEGYGLNVSGPLLFLLPSSLVTAGSLVGLYGYTKGAHFQATHPGFFLFGGLFSVAVLLGFVLLPDISKLDLISGTLIEDGLSYLRSMSITVRARNVLLTILVYIALWIGAGCSFHVILASLVSSWSWPQLPLSMGVFTLAWVMGLVVLIAPGGLGIREGTMMVLLLPWLSEPLSLVAALLSRGLWMICEILFFLGSWFLYWSQVIRIGSRLAKD